MLTPDEQAKLLKLANEYLQGCITEKEMADSACIILCAAEARGTA